MHNIYFFLAMHVKSFSISLQLSKVVTENLFSPLRPISDAKLFMSQTLFELRPTQVIDSDADLNCSWTKFKKPKMLISIKLHAYKIRYNNLCISFGTWKVWHLNQSHSEVAAKLKFRARLGKKNSWAVQFNSIQFNWIPDNYFTL